MTEDRQAVREHLTEVRHSLCPMVQEVRFPGSARLLARFDGILADWEARRPPDAAAIVGCVNEIGVAVKLLALDEARACVTHFHVRLRLTRSMTL
jgi:hypothetical protein